MRWSGLIVEDGMSYWEVRILEELFELAQQTPDNEGQLASMKAKRGAELDAYLECGA